MSLPGLLAQPVTQALIGTLNPIDSLMAIFNTNPYFIGLMMLILNLGGRFLMLEVSKDQEQVFQNPWVRRGLIFIVLFVATRSVVTAFWLTIIAVLLLGYLFNENSAMCVFSSGRNGSKCAKGDKDGEAGKSGLTPEEQDILRRLNEKYMRYSKVADKSDGGKEDADTTEIYMANMELLHK